MHMHMHECTAREQVLPIEHLPAFRTHLAAARHQLLEAPTVGIGLGLGLGLALGLGLGSAPVTRGPGCRVRVRAVLSFVSAMIEPRTVCVRQVRVKGLLRMRAAGTKNETFCDACNPLSPSTHASRSAGLGVINHFPQVAALCDPPTNGTAEKSAEK